MSYCHNYCIFSGVLICRSVFKGSLVISWLGKTGTGTRRCSLGWEQTQGWGLGAGGSTGDAAGSCMDTGCLPAFQAAGTTWEKKTKEKGVLHCSWKCAIYACLGSRPVVEPSPCDGCPREELPTPRVCGVSPPSPHPTLAVP